MGVNYFIFGVTAHKCIPFILFTVIFVYSTEINTTAEANTVSTQGINEEHPQHVLTGLPSPKIPPTPTTGISIT